MILATTKNVCILFTMCSLKTRTKPKYVLSFNPSCSTRYTAKGHAKQSEHNQGGGAACPLPHILFLFLYIMNGKEANLIKRRKIKR